MRVGGQRGALACVGGGVCLVFSPGHPNTFVHFPQQIFEDITPLYCRGPKIIVHTEERSKFKATVMVRAFRRTHKQPPSIRPLLPIPDRTRSSCSRPLSASTRCFALHLCAAESTSEKKISRINTPGSLSAAPHQPGGGQR